jgi:hypothetical protein
LLPKEPQAAKALGISVRSLYSLSKPRGPIPVVRLGPSTVRYSVPQLQAFIDAGGTTSDEAPPVERR